MTSFSFFKYFDAFELDVNVVNCVYYGKTRFDKVVSTLDREIFSMRSTFTQTTASPGADSGFPVGGGASSLGGHQQMILLNFAKNCMKLRKFWAVGGGGARPARPH